MSGSIVMQFVACDDIGSNIIKRFSRGWCSHVDAVLPDGRLLGARFDGGVAIRAPDYEVFARKLQVRLQTADEVVTAFHDALYSQIGKPYDKTAIVAFALDRNWQEDDSWMCSEYQAWGLQQANFFPHPLAAIDSQITPRDLLLVVSPFSADATMVG